MPRPRLPKLLALCLLIGLLIAGAVALFATPQGQQVVADPHAFGQSVRHWVAVHPIIAPAAFLGLYLVLCILALPVWWLQILGGYGFGMVLGIVWSQVGATLGATITVLLTRWLTIDWFQSQVGQKMQKLQQLSQKLGHNGFLVVMAVRLAHVLPFGLGNYAFGLTSISAIDVAVGSLLGGIPSATVYVTIGANRHLLHHWPFILALGALNTLMLLPIALRYLRPQWFRKLGIE